MEHANKMKTAPSRRGVLLGGMAIAGTGGFFCGRLVDAPRLRSTAATTSSPFSQNGTLVRAYTQSHFGQVHYSYIQPAMPMHIPLVCFHPTAASGDYFKDYMRDIGRDRLVIALDTPGYGKSDAPPEPQSMAQLTAALAEALDALNFGAKGRGAVDVIGYHTGCFIAGELAVARPDLVRKLILPGIPYYKEPKRGEYLEKYGFKPPLKEDGSDIQSTWDFWVKGRGPGVSFDRAAEHFFDHMQSGPRSHWAYQAVFSYMAEERFPLITQPVFVPNTHGSLKDQSRAAAALIPNAKVTELAHMELGVFDIHAAELAKLSRAFLDS